MRAINTFPELKIWIRQYVIYKIITDSFSLFGSMLAPDPAAKQTEAISVFAQNCGRIPDTAGSMAFGSEVLQT